MSSNISTSDLKDVHIFNGRRSQELGLCRRHRQELRNAIYDELDDLVNTRLFQSQFKNFLPGSDEEVRVKIRITGHDIIVQEVNESGRNVGPSQKINLNDIEDLDKQDIEEAKEINRAILEKADQIYKDHLREFGRGTRSPFPLSGRTSTIERGNRSARSLSPSPSELRGRTRTQEEQSRSRKRRRHDYERSPSQDTAFEERDRTRENSHSYDRDSGIRRRGDTRSLEQLGENRSKQNRLEERSTSVSPSRFSENHEHMRSRSEYQNNQQLDPVSFPPRSTVRNPLSVETDVAILRSNLNGLKKEAKSNSQIAQKLSKLEEQLKTLEQKIGTPSPLGVSDRKIELLEEQLEEVLSENKILKANPSSISAPLVNRYHFDLLIQLIHELSSVDVSGSTHFPDSIKDKFMELPEGIRNAVYYQTYLLVDPKEAVEDPWPIGQRLFQGTDSTLNMENLSRSHVLRHFLLHSLGSDFANAPEKTPPPELLNRFNQLPEEDRDAVLMQLEFIQPKGPDYRGPAHAFIGSDRLSVTNQERGIAFNRVNLDRVSEYHRHHQRERIAAIQRIFQDAYEKLQSQSSINADAAQLRKELDIKQIEPELASPPN